MDWIFGIGAAIAGILSFLYLIFVGQKSIPEWWRDRKTEKRPANNQNASPNLLPSNLVQHNLPHRGDFIGREKEKKQVHEALHSRSFIVTIDGIGGIGKTSLALEVLHECLAASQNSQSNKHEAQKFEAFIWTSARDRELTINDVLDTIARTLEYPFITQLTPEEKRHEISKRLQEKSCLLIVDNFETITDDAVHDFVLNLPEPSKCLITSRVQSLRQARAVSLRGLAKAEALSLIKNEGVRLGIDLEALIADDRNFQRLYEATGGAPLAIRWAIGQIKQRGQSVDGVLNSLHEARGDIFEFIFKRAWSLLSDSAKRILLIMPVFAASASKAAIEAASDVHKWELDEGLGQLVELWLVEASEKLDESKRRYGLHPLTRFFAYNNLIQHSELEHQSRVRLSEFYANFAKAAGGDKYSWEKYDDIEEEKDNVFALIEWCFKNNETVSGIMLTKSVSYFMGIRGFLYECITFGQKAVDAARQDGSIHDLAFLLVHTIAWLEIHGRDRKKGIELCREGLRIYETIGDSQGVFWALNTLVQALRLEGATDDAKYCAERAIGLARSTIDEKVIGLTKSKNDEIAVANLRRQIALLAVSFGQLEEAKKELESIVPILQEQNHLSLAGTLVDLAEVHLKLRNYDVAYMIGAESLEAVKRFKKRNTMGRVLLVLAKIESVRSNYSSALMFAKQALEFYERSGLYLERIEELKTLIKSLHLKADNLAAN